MEGRPPPAESDLQDAAGRAGSLLLCGQSQRDGMTPLTVGSLFSGIGGFEFGLERTGGFKTVWQCEIDPFCLKVLEKHWPGVKRFADIKKMGIGEEIPYVDVICGGFPCQPVSCAGKRKGKEDERWLWPEFCRVVCCVRPEWVLIENVPGLLSTDSGRLFAGILRDLSESGYDAEWNIVSAASVGAPHLRKRVFVVAHAEQQSDRRQIHGGEIDRENPERPAGRVSGSGVGCRVRHVADADQIRRRGRAGVFRQGRGEESEDCCAKLPDTRCEGLSQPKPERQHGGPTAECSRRIFERRLGRASDGLFKGLDRPWGKGWEDGTPRIATGQKDRVNRLKALGNAICPQVAQFVGQCLLDSIRTEAAQ